jgi:hypothetical protein
MRLRELHRVVQMQVLELYCLGLTFDNGLYKEIDLRPWLAERAFGVFEPLLDEDYFDWVELDPVLGTIVWPNGADLCPDVLYACPQPVKIDTADGALAVDPGPVPTPARERQALQELTYTRSQIREPHGGYQGDTGEPTQE